MVRAEMLWAHDDFVQVALEQLGDHISVLGGSLRNLSIMIAYYVKSCRTCTSDYQLTGDSPFGIVIS